MKAGSLSCSVVLTNYNGLENLKFCLPQVIKSLSGERCQEVILVDDGSTDGSCSYVREHFPSVKLVSLKSNQGFGAAANQGFREASQPVVVLLSNDIVPEKGFLDFLLSPFAREEKLFAVACRKVTPEGELDDGRKIGKFIFGRVKFDRTFSQEPEEKELKRGLPGTFYVGGFGAFDREKFLALGGFDELYLPFYWEDVDLCYRALKRGWKIFYEPRSVLIHYHQKLGTIRNFYSEKYTKVIKLRNELFFIWKNFEGSWLVFHFLTLIFRFFFSWLFFDLAFYLAFFQAISQWRKVKIRRKKEKGIKREKEASLFKKAGEYYPI